MLSRESRLDHGPIETGPRERHAGRRTGEPWNWERPIFVAAVIAILMLGAVGGVNAMIGMFPK